MKPRDLIMDLRRSLKANGIDDSNYTDFHLENSFSDSLRDLEMEVGFSTEPTHSSDVTLDFNGDTYLCDNYPILEIEEVTIDDEKITPDKYFLVDYSGIIRFKSRHSGILKISYSWGMDSKTIEKDIYPLVYDITSHYIKNGLNNTTKSITEGDFSITYGDNSEGINRSIDERIARLKAKYNSSLVAI